MVSSPAAWYLLIEIVKNLWIAVSVVVCLMSVLKVQKQSPWGVLWKGVPKNYSKFTEKHLYRCFYRMEACNLIKKTSSRAYFRHLLRAVPAHYALFQFLQTFSHSKKLKLACCLGGFRLNFFSFFIHTTHMPYLSKIYLVGREVFWRILQSI